MFDLISIFQPLFLIKIVAIIFCTMILIFILIAAKQVLNMNATIHQGGSSRLVQIIAIVNILIALSLLLTAIVIL